MWDKATQWTNAESKRTQATGGGDGVREMKREVIGEEHPEEKSMKVVRPGRKALMAVMALFIGFRPLVSPKWPRRSPLPPPCVRHRVGRDS